MENCWKRDDLLAFRLCVFVSLCHFDCVCCSSPACVCCSSPGWCLGNDVEFDLSVPDHCIFIWVIFIFHVDSGFILN